MGRSLSKASMSVSVTEVVPRDEFSADGTCKKHCQTATRRSRLALSASDRLTQEQAPPAMVYTCLSTTPLAVPSFEEFRLPRDRLLRNWNRAAGKPAE